MRAAAYIGPYENRRIYNAGEIVAIQGLVFMAKHEQTITSPPWEAFSLGRVNRDWAFLDKEGASPTKVIHRWHPAPLQYPVGGPLDNPKMSEAIDVCSDCVKQADYRNAFKPEVHLFVIQEQP